jgi:hypothetical protein
MYASQRGMDARARPARALKDPAGISEWAVRKPSASLKASEKLHGACCELIGYDA